MNEWMYTLYSFGQNSFILFILCFFSSIFVFFLCSLCIDQFVFFRVIVIFLIQDFVDLFLIGEFTLVNLPSLFFFLSLLMSLILLVPRFTLSSFFLAATSFSELFLNSIAFKISGETLTQFWHWCFEVLNCKQSCI